MKKLMIAAAIVCAAVIANAGSYDWSMYSGWTIDGEETGDDSNLEGLTAYAFDANAYSTTAFIKALGTDGDLTYLDNAMGYATIDGGEINMSSKESPDFAKITSFEGTEEPPKEYAHAYLVIMNDDNTKYFLYDGFGDALVSDTVGASGVPFSMGDNDLITGPTSGWAAVGAAPEPTSGLLLLIGVAGLALRRRRA